MAVIKYSAIVSGIQGKLNGSVLSIGRSGQVIYTKGSPRVAPTAAQLAQRQGLKSAGRTWRDLAPEQREDWQAISDNNPQVNKFGDPWTMPGYQYYQRFFRFLYPQGNDSPIFPNLANQAAYEFFTGPADLKVQLTDEGYMITEVHAELELISTSPVQNLSSLYVSLPVSDLHSPYFGTWYKVGQTIEDADYPPGLEGFMRYENVLMPPGWYSFPDAIHKLKGFFCIPDQGAKGVDQIWTGVAAFSPDVVFPNYTLFDLGGESGFFISTEPTVMLFLTFTTSDSPLPNWADYMINIQWAPPQPTTAPVPDGNWAALVNVSTVSLSGGLYFTPVYPGGGSGFGPAYYADFGGDLYPLVPSNLIPVRYRLVDIATGTEQDWQVVYLVQNIF